MRSKSEVCARLIDPGIIAVVRAQKTEQVIPLSAALIAGGVIAIEITLTTPNAFEAIRQARAEFDERAVVGVGTILNATDCQRALDAGAEFVVTPVCRPELVSLVHALDRPVMIGAFSPSEAQTAHEAGADFIKIFPADTLGPGFIKALRAPLPHLRIVPTGGVELHNVRDFLQAGCVALGVGSSLVSSRILQVSDWQELTRKAGEFVRAVQAAKAAQ